MKGYCENIELSESIRASIASANVLTTTGLLGFDNPHSGCLSEKPAICLARLHWTLSFHALQFYLNFDLDPRCICQQKTKA